jgi:hypothetical protein
MQNVTKLSTNITCALIVTIGRHRLTFRSVAVVRSEQLELTYDWTTVNAVALSVLGVLSVIGMERGLIKQIKETGHFFAVNGTT